MFLTVAQRFVDPVAFARNMQALESIAETGLVPPCLIEVMDRYARVVCFRSDQERIPLSFKLTWDVSVAIGSLFDAAVLLPKVACSTEAPLSDAAFPLTGLVRSVLNGGQQPYCCLRSCAPCSKPSTFACHQSIFKGGVFNEPISRVSSPAIWEQLVGDSTRDPVKRSHWIERHHARRKDVAGVFMAALFVACEL